MEIYNVPVSGSSLKVADYPGEEGTIIALHGLTGNNLQLRYYIEKFNPKYRFIAVDFRGRGDSGKAENPSSIFQHANDIKNLIEQLKLENVILMGYSMGGFVSALVAAEVPVKAVILLDGAATMSDHQKPIVEPTFGRLSKPYTSKEEYVTTVTGNYKNMGIETTPELIETVGYEVEEKEDHWENKACEETIRKDWNSFWSFDIKEVGKKITCPTLLIEATGNIGSNPPLFIPESYVDTKKSIPNLEVKVTDASHYTMVFQKRDDINNDISDFLLKL